VWKGGLLLGDTSAVALVLEIGKRLVCQTRRHSPDPWGDGAGHSQKKKN